LNNVIIGRAINEWQNDCAAVSMPKDSIRTHVVTSDIAKHFIMPVETLFFKDLPFTLIRQLKPWNDAPLRIAAVTGFSWYFAANITVF